MPIEIKELHIRVEISAPSSAPAATGAAPISGTMSNRGTSDKDEIVAECVEQVLQILQSKTER